MCVCESADDTRHAVASRDGVTAIDARACVADSLLEHRDRTMDLFHLVLVVEFGVGGCPFFLTWLRL